MSSTKSILRLIMWLAVAVTIGFSVSAFRSAYLAAAAKRSSDEKTVRLMGLVPQPAKHLASQFTDTQGRMLADPPASPGSFRDPTTIVLAHLTDEDADNPSVPWQQLEKHLAKVTGREVVDATFENNPGDLSSIKDGKTTLVALHAAETPFLVNNYGYQPSAVLGDSTGAEGNHLDIIVPPDSPITQPSQLRSHTLVCTVPSSITGYRAAVALLLSNAGLRPNVDYTITWSTGQKKSITGVTKKKFEAAAISDDKLQNLLKHGKVSASDYRIIYTSEVIPRTTIGWFYDLKPELAQKLREGILSFRPEKKTAKVEIDDSDSDSGPAETSGAKNLHFIPVDYKKDFQVVREIDDSFDPRMGAKPLKTHAIATKTSTTSPAN